MKKCPFCAEAIQDEAIKCKHCGEMLNKESNVGVKICPHCGYENNINAFRCKNEDCSEIFGAECSANEIHASFSKPVDYREVKKGIKQVELDQMAYKWKLIGSIVMGLVVGSMVGQKVGVEFGFLVGAIITIVLGVKSAKTYYEIDKNKR